MAQLEVMFVYRGRQAKSRVDTRLVKMFVIEEVTHEDRLALRRVLNSHAFRNEFGGAGSTQESRLILYYDSVAVPFEEMFERLRVAVVEAVAANEPARA